MNIEALAREAGWDEHHAKFDTRLERFAALIREAALKDVNSTHALQRLLRIMGTFDLATGHADTFDDALDSLESELRDVLGHYRAALASQGDALTEKQEPHGWVTMWPEPGGKHKPVFKLGKDKPRYGAELDDVLDIYPVFTTTPDSATRSADSAEPFCDGEMEPHDQNWRHGEEA